MDDHRHAAGPGVPDPGDVRVAVRSAGAGVAVVTLVGDVDVAGVDAVRAGIDEALRTADGAPADPGAGTAVVVDLSGVALLASAGLTLLLAEDRRLADRGTALLLAAPGRSARRSLRITGLDRVLRLHDDLDGALAVAPDGPGADARPPGS